MIWALILNFALAAGTGPTDYLRLSPKAVPASCKTGDIRVDSGDSNKLKICRPGNAWDSLLDSTSGISGIFTGNHTSGTVGQAVVTLSTIASSQLSGTVSQAVLGTYLGVLSASQIPAHDTSLITSGTFAQARLGTYLGSIAVSQVIGTLAQAQLGTYLGSVAASQVNSGTLAYARLGTIDGSIIASNLAASQTTTGSFDTARIPFLNADWINAGTLATARLGSIPGSSVVSSYQPVIGTRSSSFIATTNDLEVMNISNGLGTLATAAISKIVTFQNVNSTGGTLFRAGTDLIYNGQSGGTTSIALPQQWDSVTLQSNASSSWFVTGYRRAPKITALAGASSGTFTTEPGTRYLIVKMVGAGSGGGGGGLNAGGQTNGTLGTGGTFGASVIVVAPGAIGATVGAAGGAGGAGCTLSGATQIVSANGGYGAGGSFAPANGESGSNGGASFYGGNGGGGPVAGAGNVGQMGGGGGGGGTNAVNGYGGSGGGAGGYCEAIIYNPAAQYTWTMGTGGGAGGAGTSGSAGGAGGNGVGTVVEYFQ